MLCQSCITEVSLVQVTGEGGEGDGGGGEGGSGRGCGGLGADGLGGGGEGGGEVAVVELGSYINCGTC